MALLTGRVDANKVDKVDGATNGNFAGLDANGNLTDSGSKASDFISAAAITYENLDSNGDVGTGSGQLAIGNHDHSGVYEPADATILKSADIGVTVQAAGSYLTDITGESFGDLSNVVLTTPSNTQVLQFNGTNWVNVAASSVGVTDHTALSNIGTNTHAQIDTHIADSTLHFTQAAISITESQISDLQSYILAAGVTYENLSANGDIGTGSTQVAQGDHDHSGVYEPANANIQSHISSTTVHVTKQIDTVQTTDATPTVLATIAIATDEEKVLKIRAHGHEDATDDHIWKDMTLGVKNIAGTASLVGGVDSAVGTDAGAAAWTIVASVSSGNVIVTVTGEAAHTIDWRSTTDID